MVGSPSIRYADRPLRAPAGDRETFHDLRHWSRRSWPEASPTGAPLPEPLILVLGPLRGHRGHRSRPTVPAAGRASLSPPPRARPPSDARHHCGFPRFTSTGPGPGRGAVRSRAAARRVVKAGATVGEPTRANWGEDHAEHGSAGSRTGLPAKSPVARSGSSGARSRCAVPQVLSAVMSAGFGDHVGQLGLGAGGEVLRPAWRSCTCTGGRGFLDGTRRPWPNSCASGSSGCGTDVTATASASTPSGRRRPRGDRTATSTPGPRPEERGDRCWCGSTWQALPLERDTCPSPWGRAGGWSLPSVEA